MFSENSRQRVGFAWKAIQIRLRFVALLAAMFLLVGQWDRVRGYWDSAWARVSGHSPQNQAVSSDIEFFCPMDPGVVNDWPSICPVCNMVLVKRKKGEMAVLPEGVVARMQFSPYRVQLAGIRTVPVSLKPLVYSATASGSLTNLDEPNPKKLALHVSLPARFASVKWPDRSAKVTSRDVPGIEPLVGIVVTQSSTTLHLEVDNPHELLRPGMWVAARFAIPFTDLEPFNSTNRTPHAETVLTIPESAVVDFGTRKLVYVESEPGTFDGLEVILGTRCDEEFPVLNGLVAGQRVAITGAFLIDAEARLNPNLAAGYFGAAQRSTPSQPSPTVTPATSADAKPKSSKQTSKVRLSKADTALVNKQRICPVTGLPLDSMGGPMPIVVQGRRVFICCEGCESSFQKEPEKFLAKLPRP
jgi:Cu(I)/Ag(I) efflux system membrane fusion protein